MSKNLKLLMILSLLSLISCRSSQDLIYVRDSGIKDKIQGIPMKLTEHILKPGDIIYVSIKTMNAEINALYNPESNMEGSTGQGYQKFTTPSGAYLYGFEIDTDGFIHLPMLGDLKVSGVIISKAESIVQKKTDEFITDAIVKLKLLNFKFTVMGEVRNPGVYYNYNNSITVMEAIAMANGNTDFASIKMVRVIRPGADGVSDSYLLDLSSKDAFQSEAFYLQPNDYVVIQPDKYKNFQLNSQAYSLIFSSLSVMLAVVGILIK